MGLFGGKDDNKVGITLSTEPLPQTAQVKQDNSVEDQKYESLKSQWEQIPGILVYTEGTAFSKTRECKFSIQNGEYIITESLDGKYMYQEIPSVLRQIRLGKEYSHKLYNEIPQITKSDDYVGELSKRVDGIKICLLKNGASQPEIIINIKKLEQDFSPVQEIFQHIHIRNFYNVIDIPKENFNVRVMNGAGYFSNNNFIMMRKNNSLIWVRVSNSGWDGRYVTMVELEVGDILYYKSEGALRYEQQLSGGGGMGINYGSAVIGGLLFGQAGAMIGSRRKEEVKEIESRTIAHDTRAISVAFRKNGRIYQVGFDINSELAFDWLIPEKQYDYVIQKRREQYEKANQ